MTAADVPPGKVLEHLEVFQAIANANNGNRASGTSGYRGSVDYVVGKLATLLLFLIAVTWLPGSSQAPSKNGSMAAVAHVTIGLAGQIVTAVLAPIIQRRVAPGYGGKWRGVPLGRSRRLPMPCRSTSRSRR